MRDRLILWTAVIVPFLIAGWAQGWLSAPTEGAEENGLLAEPPRRIIALAPSVTETLFAIGAGDRVVGVGRWSDYPAEARNLPQVGGYLDPNLEQIVALRPDLVAELKEHQASLPWLGKLGMRRIAVSHQTLEGILESIPTLGRACGVPERAAALEAEMRARLAAVERRTRGLPRPTVLLVVQRDPNAVQDCMISGSDGFFERIFEIAGGESVGRSLGIRYPLVSPEGILHLKPEVIIDIAAGIEADGRGAEAAQARALDAWARLSELPAVRNRRIYALVSDEVYRPGPRVVKLVERIAELLHPESSKP